MSYLKSYSHVNIIMYITKEYLMNRIIRLRLEYLKPFNCAQINA